jgi:hypothetical protein
MIQLHELNAKYATVGKTTSQMDNRLKFGSPTANWFFLWIATPYSASMMRKEATLLNTLFTHESRLAGRVAVVRRSAHSDAARRTGVMNPKRLPFQSRIDSCLISLKI